MRKLIFITLAVLLPFIVVAGEYGPFLVPTPVLGTSARDSLLIPDLYNWLGGTSAVGKYVYVSSTTDLAAPMNEAYLIEKHTTTSGLLCLDTASSSSVGPSADWTLGDVIWVMDNPPISAKIRVAITATKIATGVAVPDYMLYLTNSADSAKVDAGYIDSIRYEIIGARGITSWGGTATKAGTAGASIAEAQLYDSNTLDTINNKLEYAEDMLEALRDSLEDANDLIQSLYASSGGANDLDTLVVFVNHVLADSVWSNTGESEVIIMPNGALIEGWLTVRDSIDCLGDDSVSVCMGDGTAIILTKFAKINFDVSEFITFQTPSTLGTYRVENPITPGFNPIGDGAAGTGVYHFISTGADIGFNVQTATIVTTGYTVWTLVYRRISGTGTPTAGLGGDL